MRAPALAPWLLTVTAITVAVLAQLTGPFERIMLDTLAGMMVFDGLLLWLWPPEVAYVKVDGGGGGDGRSGHDR